MSARAAAADAGRLRVARLRSVAARIAARIEELSVVRVVAAFVVVEWLAVLATALVVRHAGWIYYQGGDQLWYYTLGWLLGHGEITQTLVGYGWSAMLAPVARIAGPNLVSALPAIVLLNVLVLMPVAVFALYGIAARIGGRLFGYWTLLLWIALPFVGILYTNPGYHQRYTELLLPQAFGLTAMADFPTTVATIVAVYFCARALLDEQPQLVDGLAAGAAAGVAIAIKPSTSIFLAGPALAFAYRRRFQLAGAMLAGLAPAVVALAVWKARGLGYIPLISSAGPQPVDGVAAAAPLAGLNLGEYLHKLDWSSFLRNLDLIREHFWSVRLIEWLVFAGLIGIGRRSRTALLLVGGWFGAFVVVKGSYANASIEDGSFFRVMMPSYPAFVLLIAFIPLLLPHAPARLTAWRPAFRARSPRSRWALVAAVIIVSAVLPLAAFAAVNTGGPDVDRTTVGATIMPVPANVDIGLAAALRHGQVLLTWRKTDSLGGPVFFRVLRGRTDGLSCPQDRGAQLCKAVLPEVGVTHTNRLVDRAPAGRWVYRVAVAANWLNDPGYGDPYLVSRAVAITVPG